MPSVTAGNVITDSAQILPGIIVNSDINAAAAIDYSKLALALSIVNADISASAAIVDTKLAQIATASKVSGAALTSLANIPAGAGVIPAAHIPAAPTTNTNGNFTKDLTDANGATTVVAHGLGSAPSKVRASCSTGNTAGILVAFGSWDSSGQTYCRGLYHATGGATASGTGCIQLTDLTDANKQQLATVTVDATNITFTWAKTSTPSGTPSVHWEATL